MFVLPISKAAADEFAERNGGQTPAETAGLVGLSHARQNDALIGLYHGPTAGLEGPWVTICEKHNQHVAHPNRLLAESHMADPEGWCRKCRRNSRVRAQRAERREAGRD